MFPGEDALASVLLGCQNHKTLNLRKFWILSISWHEENTLNDIQTVWPVYRAGSFGKSDSDIN